MLLKELGFKQNASFIALLIPLCTTYLYELKAMYPCHSSVWAPLKLTKCFFSELFIVIIWIHWVETLVYLLANWSMLVTLNDTSPSALRMASFLLQAATGTPSKFSCIILKSKPRLTLNSLSLIEVSAMFVICGICVPRGKPQDGWVRFHVACVKLLKSLDWLTD
jgi:hypothetical protein